MKQYKYILLTAYSVLLLAACSKVKTYDNPYSGGKDPLGIVFSNANIPVPNQGLPGDIITFKATGLVKYKTQVAFQFNGEAGEIQSITDSTIVVKITQSASSGSVSISIGDQVYFGPQFQVLGKVSFDPFFKGINGTDDSNSGTDDQIMSALTLSDGRRILTGAFRDYNKSASDISSIRCIVLTTADGEIDKSFRFGNGGKDYIRTIVQSQNKQKFYIAGGLNSYDKLSSHIDNITSTLANGVGDSIKVTSFSTAYTGIKYLSAPTFNGGANNPINQLFNSGNKIIAVGNFTKYVTHNYANGRLIVKTDPITGIITSTPKDSITTDSIGMQQLIRFTETGGLDKTYHYDAIGNKTLDGGNGSITNACQLPDGRLVLVGAFSKFDGNTAGRIVRLNLDGTVDATFNVGSGANATISSIFFNTVAKKYLLTGSFGTFNGSIAKSMVMLNEDGSIDNSFMAKDFANGFPSFAKQLSNGLIIVSGGFKKYNNIKRPGFIILNPAGALAPGYNTYGDLSGSIADAIEGKNADNKMNLLLIGSFTKFDGKTVSNTTSLVLE
jgi:hypothetical protein